MSQQIQFKLEIGSEHAGQRLDRVLSELLPDYSRGRLQAWIKTGEILLNGRVCKPKDKVYGGEQIAMDATLEDCKSFVEPQKIALDVHYEDDSIIVINKPAGLVVHPAAGHADNTLQNALLYSWPDNAAVPRAGIVHRLDKLTSGLMVVAKTLIAHNSLVGQLSNKSVNREYWAIVYGVVTAGGKVDQPIGRHPIDRKKMSINLKGKLAVSYYRVVDRYRSHSLLAVKLETGRTHQIRVHMASIRYPLLGDPVYGGRLRIPKQASEQFTKSLRDFRRQALHARTLGLVHPLSGEQMTFTMEPPEDFTKMKLQLEKDLDEHQS